MTNSRFLLFCLAGFCLYWFLSHDGDARTNESVGPIDYPGYSFSKLQPYELTGRVLSMRSYRNGRESELSPIDIALAWGDMSDPAKIAQVDFSQRDRWMFWTSKKMPMPRAQLEQQIGNVHVIPRDHAAAAKLKALTNGALVTLRGDLVEVRGDDGWSWRSSLSRSDTGKGSCELLLLRDIDLP